MIRRPPRSTLFPCAPLFRSQTGNDPQPQLFRITEDPGEKNNLATVYPGRVKKMLARLEQIGRTILKGRRHFGDLRNEPNFRGSELRMRVYGCGSRQTTKVAYKSGGRPPVPLRLETLRAYGFVEVRISLRRPGLRGVAIQPSRVIAVRIPAAIVLDRIFGRQCPAGWRVHSVPRFDA